LGKKPRGKGEEKGEKKDARCARTFCAPCPKEKGGKREERRHSRPAKGEKVEKKKKKKKPHKKRKRKETWNSCIFAGL